VPRQTTGKHPLPRGQVMTVIVAGIVSLVFGIAGIITEWLFLR
jgi:hypothetical protein